MDGKIKEKTVKRRIFLSNALMILVTLGLIAAVNAVIIKVYWEAMEQKWQFSLEETMGDPANMEVLIKEWTVHQHSFYVLLLVDALICVGILILVSLFFTRNLEKHIRKPLEILEDGAKRIRDNVLTEEISYRGDAEFEEICTAFNEMQSHVLLEQEKNRKYEKARTEMIAGISHDLRTPLTAVRGTIKGLMDGVVKEPVLQAKFLQTAYRRTGDMDVLLNQLFYLSKLETGSMPLNLQKTDLAEFIRSYAEGKQSILDETEIQLRIALEVQTARTESVDKIRGLGVGADDYISKPFDPAELVARVNANLRQYDRVLHHLPEEPGEAQQEICVQDLRILVNGWKVYKKDQEIKLTNREFELLKFLAMNPNIVFSKEQLFEKIWGYDYTGDSATVMVHMNRIREKIEDDSRAPKILETVWGAGYRLNK